PGRCRAAPLGGGGGGAPLGGRGGNAALELAVATELARLDRREGKLYQAAQQFRYALDRARRIEHKPNAVTAAALHDLSLSLRVTGHLDEALAHAREGLALVQSMHGEQHARTALLHTDVG